MLKIWWTSFKFRRGRGLLCQLQTNQRPPRRQVSFNPQHITRSTNDRQSILKNWRSPERNNEQRHIQKPARNSVDKYGNQSPCSLLCESINHWENNDSDRHDKDTYLVYEIILHANQHSPEHMQTLLNCVATHTVCLKMAWGVYSFSLRWRQRIGLLQS